jgi:hypothetical protein
MEVKPVAWPDLSRQLGRYICMPLSIPWQNSWPDSEEITTQDAFFCDTIRTCKD